MTAMRFDPFEFSVRWHAHTGEDLPEPLTIVTDFDSYDEFRRERDRVLDAVAAESDPDQAAVFAALTDADMAVVVVGFQTESADTPARSVRAYGVRSGGRSLIATQQPGKTVRDAAAFTVTEHDSNRWAASLIAALPQTAAGRRGPVSLPDPDAGVDGLDYSYGRSSFRDDDRDDIMSAALLAAPVIASGAIEIRQMRSVFGPSGRARRRITWCDVANDGRYAILARPPYTAKPADPEILTALLSEEIEEIQLAIDDDRRSVPG
ncbi:MAG: ESX secretion-associated protein EspG [Mycobacteriaceae bacterium]|nr:ESX secretion-associated protein EspG [Mycobacteriaceae bacterium]